MNIEVLCNSDLNSFKQIVSNKKLKQIHVVWLCLKRVEFHPEEASIIGVLWNSASDFMMNSYIFGLFINRKPNTMNRGFRSHGFIYKKSSDLMRRNIPKKFDFNNFPDQKNWILRRCEGFTKNTTEIEAIKWKSHDLIPKKHKINQNQFPIIALQATSNLEIQNNHSSSNFISLSESEIDETFTNLNTQEVGNLEENYNDVQEDLLQPYLEDSEYLNLDSSYFENEDNNDSFFYSENHMNFYDSF